MKTTFISFLALCASTIEASNPKRGMISDLNSATYTQDVAKFTSDKVTHLSWYYSFGHYPDENFSKRYQFTMQQFGVDTTSDNGNNFKNLNTLMSDVDQYRPEHLMTFLEPAISGISVADAVSAWKQYIIPIQQKYPKMKIGSPSVINGPDSLPWINEFVQTCPECKFDFLDVHYYWTTSEFQGFVEMWHKRFPNKPMWVSDIGFQSYSPNPPECEKGDKTCVPDIKTQIKFLDKKRYVKRYTFRGEFRTTQGQAHQPLWSFLNDNGDYTPLGKWYLGIAA